MYFCGISRITVDPPCTSPDPLSVTSLPLDLPFTPFDLPCTSCYPVCSILFFLVPTCLSLYTLWRLSLTSLSLCHSCTTHDPRCTPHMRLIVPLSVFFVLLSFPCTLPVRTGDQSSSLSSCYLSRPSLYPCFLLVPLLSLPCTLVSPPRTRLCPTCTTIGLSSTPVSIPFTPPGRQH